MDSPQMLETEATARPTRHVFGMASIFHKAEVVYVIVMLTIGMVGILRINREMLLFAVLWTTVCLVAAVVALAPRVPRLLAIVAEVVLFCVAAGQIIGPWHDVLPLLGREVRGPIAWNDIPLTERRILTWNICCAFAIAWLVVPVAMVNEQLGGPGSPGRRVTVGKVLGGLVMTGVWVALGVLFVLVAQAFLL
jgi:hypothetical protein